MKELEDHIAQALRDTHNAGLEEAAKWHDFQAIGHDSAGDRVMFAQHRVYAAAIRSLKVPE